MRLKRNLLLASHWNSKIKMLLECYLERSSVFKKSCICMNFRTGACIIIKTDFEQQGQQVYQAPHVIPLASFGDEIFLLNKNIRVG